MSSRHQPLNGADSEPHAESYVLRPFRVLMCDRWEPDIRFNVRIAAALGKHDAINQARDRHPEASWLRVEEITEEVAA